MLELVITLLLTGIAAAAAMHDDYRNRTITAQAEADVVDKDGLIVRFQSDNNGRPTDNLRDTSKAGLLDRWNNPCSCLDLTTGAPAGSVRKDRNLVPLYSDYHLYSGNDGARQSLPTARARRENIVGAVNRRLIGLAFAY